MKKVKIIYNPFSGKKHIKNIQEVFNENLKKSLFDYEFLPTQKATDLIKFSVECVKENIDLIIAAGGDGTVNQIASQIVNSNCCLGIVPMGSGNGFARFLNMPMNVSMAIQKLNNLNEIFVDTIWINGNCLVNVGGIGFDAHISSLFAKIKKRGLWGYVKVIAQNINYKCEYYELFNHKKELIFKGKAFMISIANANQWGNNVHVYKGAKPNDGIMDILVLKDFKWFYFPQIIYNLIKGNLYQNKKSLLFSGTKFFLKRNIEGAVHTDGEPLWMGKELEIELEPLSLKVLSNEKK